MYKICINGIVRDMTPEEIAELEAMPAPQIYEETVEEKLAKIEQLYDEIKTMIGVKE